MNNRTLKTGRALVSLALVITASAAVIPSSTSAGLPSIRLVSPVYTAANSVDATGDITQYYSAGTKAFYTYIAAGSTMTLKYHVTTDGTTSAANVQIVLQANAPYSGSKANWTSGGTVVGPQTDGNFGAEIKKKTNAMGEVTFILKNTDSSGLENAPTAFNQDRGAIKPARLFGTIKPVIPGFGDKESDTDLVTFDIHTPIAKTSIKCLKGKMSKTVIGILPVCPEGYTLKK